MLAFTSSAMRMRIGEPAAPSTGYGESNMQLRRGIIIGHWDEKELEAERKRLGLTYSPEYGRIDRGARLL